VSLTYVHAECIYAQCTMLFLSSEISMSYQNQTKIMHDKLNKECSLLTPYSAVQGTGCNVD